MKNKKHEICDNGAKTFMSGVLVLSVATVAVKIIGLAFKIPMLSFLGAEGMGYFNSAYEIYALLCVISTAGMPVALSMLVSAARAKGDDGMIKSVYRNALAVFVIFGAVGSAAMLIFAEPLSRTIGNPNAYLCIIAIAPALLFICLASAIRGYCQGFEKMIPTAISQLIEALCKLVLGIVFAMTALKKGYDIPTVAAFAVMGITIGTLFSFVYLAIAKKNVNKDRAKAYKREKTHKGVIFELLKIALPITLASAVLGFTRIIDMLLIIQRLQDIDYSVADANKIYGAYTTLAVPVFSLIPALITPISMALVPRMSSFIVSNDEAGQVMIVENSLRLTSLLAMPASVGLTAFAYPVLNILFSGQSEAINIAAPLLALLGGSVLFSCLITTTNAILQSYRRVALPIISMLIGVLVKLIASYILIGTEGIGAYGAPIGSFACNTVVVLLNLLFISRCCARAVDVKRIFMKPLLASVIAISAAVAVYMWTFKRSASVYISFAFALAIALTSYALLAKMLGIVTEEDVALIPMGDKFLKYIQRKNKSKEKKNDYFREEADDARKG